MTMIRLLVMSITVFTALAGIVPLQAQPNFTLTLAERTLIENTTKYPYEEV